MTGIQLFRLDTASDSSHKVERLAEILRRFIPLSLPILGLLFSGEIETGCLSIFTSFDLSSVQDIPELFSVVLYSSLAPGDKLRFFCSAEPRSEPPSVEEQNHVFTVLTTLYRALRTSSPNVQGIQTDSAFFELKGRRDVITVGSLHEKWVPCLQCISIPVAPCIKFVRPPRMSSPDFRPWDSSPDARWVISEPQECDIDLIIDRAVFKRSREAMRTRLQYAVCIKPEGQTTPVAWMLLYPDGSMGMLHVEPEYRQMGLAKLCFWSLSRKLEEMFRPAEDAEVGKYPWARWELVDVVAGNAKGSALLKSLESEGWRKRWQCYWVSLTMDDHSNVDGT